MFKYLKIFLLMTVIPVTTLADSNPVAEKIFIESDYAGKIDELRALYGKNKSIPAEFELPCLIALSFYPELTESKIDFIYTSTLKTTMAARPKANFFLGKRKNRKYVIFINSNKKNKDKILLENISFNAQIGVIGHELAHILDYSQKGTWSILGDGLFYKNHHFRKKFEHSTDLRALNKGLGWQLWEFSDFVMNRSDAPEKYKNYKRKIYMTPNQILQHLNFEGEL